MRALWLVLLLPFICLTVGFTRAKPEEGLNRDEVRAGIHPHTKEIQACHEAALKGEPTMTGRYVVSFTINALGRVTRADVKSRSAPRPKLEGCLLQVLRSAEFPRPRGGTTVHVDYPFVFKIEPSSDGSNANPGDGFAGAPPLPTESAGRLEHLPQTAPPRSGSGAPSGFGEPRTAPPTPSLPGAPAPGRADARSAFSASPGLEVRAKESAPPHEPSSAKGEP